MIAYPPEAIGHLLEAMLAACDRLSFPDESDAGLTSSRLAFRTALSEILERERGGVAFARRRLEQAREAAALVLGRDAAATDGEPEAACEIPEMEARAVRLLEDAEIALAGRSALSPADIGRLCREEAAALEGHGSIDDNMADAVPETAITRDRLERYLRARTGDGALALVDFRPLMGGFGKETLLFTARGRSLHGEFVIRRDQPLELVPGACHQVVKEYEVIKAVRAAGFPAPEALWLEQGDPIVPGPDFIVMRRSAGRPPGTLVGASGAIDPALNDELGWTMGKLHSLPPLLELGDLTESIRRDQWAQSGRDIVHGYIEGMRSMLLGNPHAPSLGTVAGWNWLDAHMPEDLGGACLIHGDIGFHNMLHGEQGLVCLLDWENAQIGHAGMDLGYVYNAAGDALDWPRVMRAYEVAGGRALSARALAYFRIMMSARVATTVNVGPAKLFCGAVPNLRLLNAEMQFRGHALKCLARLIEAYMAEYPDTERCHGGTA